MFCFSLLLIDDVSMPALSTVAHFARQTGHNWGESRDLFNLLNKLLIQLILDFFFHLNLNVRALFRMFKVAVCLSIKRRFHLV